MAKPDVLPLDSALQNYPSSGDFSDSYSVDISKRKDLQDCNIRELGALFGNIEVSWAVALLKLRNLLMAPLNLKTTDRLVKEQITKPTLEKQVGDRIAFFDIYEICDNEIILGQDDWHQDFRVSLYRTTDETPRVIMTTVCKRHNAFGHVYLAAILPFHKLIVRSALDTGAQKPLAAA